jgi:hypothetical protein
VHGYVSVSPLQFRFVRLTRTPGVTMGTVARAMAGCALCVGSATNSSTVAVAFFSSRPPSASTSLPHITHNVTTVYASL